MQDFDPDQIVTITVVGPDAPRETNRERWTSKALANKKMGKRAKSWMRTYFKESSRVLEEAGNIARKVLNGKYLDELHDNALPIRSSYISYVDIVIDTSILCPLNVFGVQECERILKERFNPQGIDVNIKIDYYSIYSTIIYFWHIDFAWE